MNKFKQKFIYPWLGEKYSATEWSFSRGGKHWTTLPIMQTGHTNIWDLFTKQYRVPLRYWPIVISKRWQWSFGERFTKWYFKVK